MIASLLALAAVVLLTAADQITKLLVMKHFTVGESHHVIGGLLDFTYVQNRGAAFGMLSSQRWFFMLITVVIMAAVVYGWFKGYFHHITGRIAAVLIVAGGLGNMIDRVRLGYVVDFIDVSPLFSFAVFNVADCCVTVGAGLLMVFILFFLDEQKLRFENPFARWLSSQKTGKD